MTGFILRRLGFMAVTLFVVFLSFSAWGKGEIARAALVAGLGEAGHVLELRVGQAPGDVVIEADGDAGKALQRYAVTVLIGRMQLDLKPDGRQRQVQVRVVAQKGKARPSSITVCTACSTTYSSPSA